MMVHRLNFNNMHLRKHCIKTVYMMILSIMYTVLYGVCVNADLLIHDHFASTLEHAEYLMPSRLVCPQCDIEKSIPTEHRLITHANHLLYITCPSMIEGIQQTQHTDLQIHITRCRAVYHYISMIKHVCTRATP